jgi:hypothetical protein
MSTHSKICSSGLCALKVDLRFPTVCIDFVDTKSMPRVGRGIILFYQIVPKVPVFLIVIKKLSYLDNRFSK